MLGSWRSSAGSTGANSGTNGAGVKYKAVVRELEQILTRPLEQLLKEDEFFDDLRKRLDDLETAAPVVPEGIYRQVEKRYASVVFSDNVASFIM